MRIKPHRLLFAALLAPAFVTPVVSAQEAPEATPPNALVGREVIAKAGENARSLGWELGIEFEQPQRIEVTQPDGSVKPYWYVIYRIINANTTSTSDSLDDATGIPVSTDLSFFVEAISGANELTEPAAIIKDNGLLKSIRLDVIRERMGKDLDLTKGSDRDEYDRLIEDAGVKEISDIRYRDAYQAHGDANNHYVLKKIAELEGHRFHNRLTGQSELELQPASAFTKHMGLAYDLENESETFYAGVRAIPRSIEVPNDTDPTKGNVSMIYPGVDADGALVRWFTADEIENDLAGAANSGAVNRSGTTIVVNSKSAWFGMLLKTRYQEGGVVDSMGRPVQDGEPTYQQALADFGRRAQGGEVAVVAKTRTYQEGEKILNGYDTGVSRGDGMNHIVYGRILDNDDLFADSVAASLRADEGRLRRGPDSESEVDSVVGRKDNSLSNIDTIDSSTQAFGRDVVGQPVKVLDRFGRAVTMELVLYGVGDFVTADEYNIWARRMSDPTSFADSGLASRPLAESDFMIGRPKIRMGQASGAALAADPATGRRYKVSEVSPEGFLRDADGTYFSYRIAPIQGADEASSATTYYPYAPLGRAANSAVPVPSFDSFDTWKDWLGADGQPVPLLDASGKVVVDSFGIQQNLKAYDYEWRYAYQRAPIVDDQAHDRDRDSDSSFNTQTLLKDARQTIPAWKDAQGNFASLALRTVYGEKTVDDVTTLRTLTKVVDESDFDKAAFMADYAAPDLMAGYEIKFTAPNQVVRDNAVVDEEREGLTYEPKFQLTQHLFDSIVTLYKGNKVGPESNVSIARTPVEDNKHLQSNPIVADSFGDMAGNPIFKTWERFTIPAPIVRDGKVLTREEVEIASGLLADNSDAAYGLKNLISERYGVLILNDVDDGWDYLNVVVRGLRAPFDGSRFEKSGAGNSFTRKLKYQDWAYMERFSKPGDEYNVKRDLIARERGRWFLLNSEE